MRSRRALPALAALLLAVLLAALAPAEPGFAIKGDEATYVSMALSLAYDGDLRFTANDLHRFEALYGKGPIGIFLQQPRDLHVALHAGWPPLVVTRTPRPARAGLAFGKPFVYPVVAAPFIRVAGLRGLLFLNLLLLAAIVWMGWRFASSRLTAVSAGLIAVAFVGASIAPVYAVWRTPEVLNLALVFAGYFLWLYKHVATDVDAVRPRWLVHPWTTYAGAGLLGLATYSKPPNALLIVPIVLMALLTRRLRDAIALSVVFLALSAGAFAVNGLIAGEMNYQGGDRRTFAERFPYSDQNATFAQMGSPMVTEHSDAQSLLAPSFFVPLFEHNTEYFFLGRDAGLLPYFFPGVVILLAWLVRPRAWTPWQLLIALFLAASVVIMLALAPYTWNGGGGPPGNRYFLSLYPVMFFLLPAGLPAWVAGSAFAGLLVTGPLVAHPLASSYGPWHNVEHGVVRALPVELTLVDDLPVRLDLSRARLSFKDTLLYLMDENAFQPETDGFWVAGAARADIVVRTDRAIDRATLQLRSGVPNHLTLSLGRSHTAIDLQTNVTETVLMHPGPGVVYTNGSRAYVLRITTSNGFVPSRVDPASHDQRDLGVFVVPDFRLVEPPPTVGR